MFKGCNILKLNEATLIAAVEEYINGRILASTDDIKVYFVREWSGSSGSAREFEIGTREQQAGDKK